MKRESCSFRRTEVHPTQMYWGWESLLDGVFAGEDARRTGQGSHGRRSAGRSPSTAGQDRVGVFGPCPLEPVRGRVGNPSGFPSESTGRPRPFPERQPSPEDARRHPHAATATKAIPGRTGVHTTEGRRWHPRRMALRTLTLRLAARRKVHAGKPENAVLSGHVSRIAEFSLTSPGQLPHTQVITSSQAEALRR